MRKGTKARDTRGPYKKAQDRREKQEEVILGWIARGFSESGAAARADLSWSQYSKWKREDNLFAARIEEAKDVGTQQLEDVATSRAKRKSDVLLMFLLKKRDPSYRDKHEPTSIPVEIRIRKF